MLIYFLFILAKKKNLLKKLDSFARTCGIKQGKYNA
jgi:hypothetical protein